MRSSNKNQIYSLGDSDEENYTQRRSKSSERFYSPKQKYFLIEKKNVDVEIEVNPTINVLTESTSNQFIIKENSNKEKIKIYENCDTQTQYEDSFNFSLHSTGKLIQNKNNSNILEYDKFRVLKEKYLKLKDKYNLISDGEKNWRTSYFKLLQDSLGYEDTIRNLLEENRIHQEYIISLENKMNKLLNSCHSITQNFHNNLYNNMTMNNLNTGGNISFSNNNTDNNLTTNTTNLFIKNYNEVLNDYKRQIEILADEKENLSTNLSIARHQQLQSTIKIEVLQTRLYNFEQARLEDLKILENLSK